MYCSRTEAGEKSCKCFLKLHQAQAPDCYRCHGETRCAKTVRSRSDFTIFVVLLARSLKRLKFKPLFTPTCHHDCSRCDLKIRQKFFDCFKKLAQFGTFKSSYSASLTTMQQN